MNKEKYIATCPHCVNEGEVEIVKVNEVYKIQGKKISVPQDFYKCGHCNELFETPEIDPETFEPTHDYLADALEVYRKQYDIVSASEMREFRAKYNLTQEELSLLLGWGKVTLTRYENGAPPDTAHNNALKMAMTNDGLMALLNIKSCTLDISKVESIRSKLLKERRIHLCLAEIKKEKLHLPKKPGLKLVSNRQTSLAFTINRITR